MRLNVFHKLPKKTKQQLIRKTTAFKDWIAERRPFARGQYKVAYTKDGRWIGNRFFDKRGNLVMHKLDSVHGKSAHAKFWEMKIINDLFPRNTPKIRGMEEMLRGALFHFDAVELNPELKNYMGRLVDIFPKGEIGAHSRESNTYVVHAEKVHGNMCVRAIGDRMYAIGIDDNVFFGNASNVSVANPNVPVFFEPKIGNTTDLRAHIQTLHSKRRERLLRWLDRYEELLK
ncbi:MAG: hypothetical protein HOE11_04440 [Candidatus Diapherotrites archaeon]|jgi:hypothetical protein|nr:hypothetical protein [Candidatus Diapherotrites archaeon]MBT4597033.1 hypothetical protein [Candidatus Diapherotrites archaeon]